MQRLCIIIGDDDADLMREREEQHIRESKRNHCTFRLITNTQFANRSTNKSCTTIHDTLTPNRTLLEMHFQQTDSIRCCFF